MNSNKMFTILPSWEDARECEDTRARNGNWNRITEFAAGELPLVEYSPLQLTLNVSDISVWDLYRCPGTFGLFSQKPFWHFVIS
jgi:hypothetical protein